jgi:hypothetical protein
MQALFLCNYDVGTLPKRTQRILCWTSLWMMVPVAYSRSVALQCLLTMMCAVSTSFWMYPKKGSFLHATDKICAWGVLAAMLANSSDIGSALCFLGALFGTFMASNHMVGEAQLIAHLSFRFVFFWWVFVIMVGIPLVSVFVTTSSAYWLVLLL